MNGLYVLADGLLADGETELEVLYNGKSQLRDVRQAVLGRNMAEKLCRTRDIQEL